MGEPQIVLDLEASLQLQLNNANETENQNSSIHEQILIEEAQIAVDVQASPLSESSPLSKAPIVVDVQASPLSESSPLSKAPIVVDIQASPLSKAPIVVDIQASPLSKPLQRKLELQKKKMQSKLDTLWGNTHEAKNFTIFRIPQNISQSKKNLFEPSVISIGPFHHGKQSLRTLEEQKWRFLQDFLSRGDHISLDHCISEMNLLEERTRRCYSEKFDDLDSDTFVEMMLLDGCFVLEYFLKLYQGNWNSILEVGWNSNFIVLDLLLLENQIPFFIVDKLYEIGLKQEDRMSFVEYLTYYILGLVLTKETLDAMGSKISDPPTEIHHLVHLCYHYLVPSPEKPVVLSSKSFGLTRMFNSNRIKGLLARGFPHWTSASLSVGLPNSTGNISSIVIPSATELKQKGLKFTPKSNPKHMLDISFEYGVLKIPRLQITDDTKPIFTNLIAFEHSKYGKKHLPFTSFVNFLDNLVNTPNDVTLLQECGTIENWLSSEDELAQFINELTQGTAMGEDHYLAELCTEVNRYSKKTWNRQRAKLIRDYFSSPWAVISLVAALILLVLTCVQSFYAVYAYYIPPSS